MRAVDVMIDVLVESDNGMTMTRRFVILQAGKKEPGFQPYISLLHHMSRRCRSLHSDWALQGVRPSGLGVQWRQLISISVGDRYRYRARERVSDSNRPKLTPLGEPVSRSVTQKSVSSYTAAMRWQTLCQLVMWEQTLFGLPWVVTSLALVPPESRHLTLAVFFWILCAFISARIAGMALNRLIDRDIDARNPRTWQRLLPSGEVSPLQVGVVGLAGVAVFVFSCGMINSVCLMLSPIPLALLCAYSYMKRFTPLCHFVLGAIHCLSPIFAWLAVSDMLSLVPVCLGTAVMFSIAGSDVVYAILDVEFDKNARLYSIPLLLGTEKALRVAKGLHCAAIALLWVVGLLAHAHFVYFLGVLAAAGTYALCYAGLKPDLPDRLHAFLATCNRRVAILLMVFTVSAGLWQHWS